MLIASERHKAEDLELWAGLQDADRINAERPALRGRAERSILAIRDFAAAGPCYASTSWGKDSVVMADLVCEANRRFALDVAMLWVTYGAATNPGCRRVRDAFFASRRCRYIEVDVGDAESMRDDYGPANAAAGCDRYLTGVRADESWARRVSMRHRGLATARACRPLGWWRIDDVFAWMALRDLPVHENYAMLGGGRWPRGQIRTSSVGGERGCERGRRQWEQEYYGDVLRRLGPG